MNRLIKVFERYEIIQLIYIIVSVLISLAIVYYGPPYKTIAILAIGSLSFFNFNLLNKKISGVNNSIWVLQGLLSVLGIYIFSSIVHYRLTHNIEWDFTVFYLFGKVAVTGHSLYSPQHFSEVLPTLQIPFNVSPDFIKEIVNVGFWYPPPTMILFYPLGYLSYNTALYLWTFFNLIFLVGSIYLLYDLFLKKYLINGLLFTITFVLIFPSVNENILYSQTNYILLYLLLLIYKYQDKPISGIFILLAVITKPFMFVFLLIPVLKKNWEAFVYMIVSGAVVLGFSIYLTGINSYLIFIADNPSKRLPDFIYTEFINQSLNAFILRHHYVDISDKLLYFIISAILVFFSGLSINFLYKKKNFDLIFSLLLIIILLIYPFTLSYYGVLLLFVTFQLFFTNKFIQQSYLIAFVLLSIILFLNVKSTFLMLCLFFLFISYIVYKENKKPGIKENRLQ
jgi:hypothetical protein